MYKWHPKLEAIAFERVVTRALQEFEVVQERWGCALVHIKYCISWVNHCGNIELAHLKKEEEEKHLGLFAAFWFSTFMMVFCVARGLVSHENTLRWMVHCYKRL